MLGKPPRLPTLQAAFFRSRSFGNYLTGVGLFGYWYWGGGGACSARAWGGRGEWGGRRQGRCRGVRMKVGRGVLGRRLVSEVGVVVCSFCCSDG